MIDLTPYFQAAHHRLPAWSENLFVSTLQHIIHHIPGTLFDWEVEVPEYWAYLAFDSVAVGYLRRDAPLSILFSNCPDEIVALIESNGIVVAAVPDRDSALCRLDLSVATHLFPGWGWHLEEGSTRSFTEFDMEAFTVGDLWYQTIT